MLSIPLSILLLANSATVLKTARELLDYENRNRTEEVRFEIEGTVVSAPVFGMFDLCVADDSGVARLLLAGPAAETTLSAGDRVRISGMTRPADYNQFCCPHVDGIVRLGHSPPPPIPKIDAAEFNSGRYDYRVVVIEGTVREAFHDEIFPEALLIVIQTRHGFVHAAVGRINAPCTADPKNLLAQNVRMTGVVNRHPVSHRRYLGRILGATGMEAIELLPSLPTNRFDVADVAILQMENVSTISSLGRHRAEGRVLAVWEKRRRFMIQTLGGDVVYANICTISTNGLPHPGSAVTAAGYPISDGFTITLTQADWSPSDLALPPDEDPIVLSDDFPISATNGIFRSIVSYNGRTVRIAGTVLRVTDNEFGENVLLLETGKRIVRIPECGPGSPFDALTPGCRVSITGICSLETDSSASNRIFPQVTGFSIVPRTEDDLVILARPPWWTPTRLLVLVAGLLTALVAILFWNRSLHRLAERRARELSRRQEQVKRANVRRLERTRLAVELHDAISQNLTGISMQLKAVSNFTSRLPEEAGKHVAFATKILASCRSELRNILWDLRHNAMDAPSMNDAIRQTLEPHLGETALELDFAIQRSRFDENTAYAVLRILRELATNAIRHGHADAIAIRAEPSSPVRITVSDNGTGFDPADHPGFAEGHFGLVGVHERVAALGGTIDIVSAPNSSGTVVTLTLPI